MAEKRGIVPEGKSTIRDKVVLALVARLGSDDGETIFFDPEQPTFGKLFDFSQRGTLEDIGTHQTPGCAIEEGDEEGTVSFFPLIDKTFRVFINFKVFKVIGVDVYSLINYYFGRIEQELVRPEEEGLHIADLTLSVDFAGNSIQYNGDSDPEPGGTIMFDITVRHVQGNPFLELPE